MAGDTLTTADAVLKQHYAAGPLLNLASQQNTTFGLLSKKNKRTTTTGGGRSWTQPIRISYPGGGSSDFGTAMAATNNASGFGVFTVTRKSHYRLAKMQTELLEATETGAEDAFEDMIDELDRGIEAEANYLNFRLFRNSGGAAGQITNSNLATTVATLKDPSDAWAWVKGDVAKAATTDGTSGSLETGSLTVASVQRSAGTITFTANLSTGITTIAQNDYLSSPATSARRSPGSATGCPMRRPARPRFTARTARSSPRCSAASASTPRIRARPSTRS